MGGEVAALGRVEEGHPHEVAEAQHEAEAVGGDVHHGQHARLAPLAGQHVPALHAGREDDAVGDEAVVAVLLRDEGEVEEQPARQPRPHLAPGLDVDLTEKGESDARVEFASDVKVVGGASGVAASGELAHVRVWIVGLHAEATEVHVEGQGVCNQNVGAKQLHVVFREVSPDEEVGAVQVCSNGAGCQLY